MPRMIEIGRTIGPSVQFSRGAASTAATPRGSRGPLGDALSVLAQSASWRYSVIKRVEVNYRGIFQKNLAKQIGSDIVMIASRMGQVAFSNGRYSDSPERNGIPCKYFAFISPDLAEEELEAECGAKLDIDEANISVVVDDTMVKGVEPWGWHGIRPINEKVVAGGALLVVSRREPDELLKWIERKPFDWKL